MSTELIRLWPVVKDCITGHNPIAALDSSHSYSRRLRGKDETIVSRGASTVPEIHMLFERLREALNEQVTRHGQECDLVRGNHRRRGGDPGARKVLPVWALMVPTQAHGSVASTGTGSRATVHAPVSSRFHRWVSIGRLAMSCWILTALAACSSSSTPLLVFAAAGAKPALDEIVRSFQHEQGREIQVSYGGGGQALARMVFAERGDVYVAPEQGFMKSAVEQAAVDPATIRDVAYMIPVLAVEKDNPKHLATLSDLARPGIRVAVTRPETTCLGRYAPLLLQRAGFSEAIGENIVTQAPRPDLLMTWLVLGEVDAIITWHFYGDLAREDIEVIWLPPEQLPGIGKMQAAVATYSENHDLACGFVDFLASAPGQAIFEKHGYIVDAKELAQHWPGAGIEAGHQPGLGRRAGP